MSNFRIENLTGISSTTDFAYYSLSRHKDNCVLMMNGPKVVQSNKLTKVLYNNPEYLASQDMQFLKRITAMDSREGTVIEFLGYFGSQICGTSWFNYEADWAKLKDNILKTFETHPKINSIKDLTLLFLAELKKWKRNITFEEVKTMIVNAIKHCASLFQDEQEWILKDKILNIPKGSILYVNEVDTQYSMLILDKVKESLKTFYDIKAFESNVLPDELLQFKHKRK